MAWRTNNHILSPDVWLWCSSPMKSIFFRFVIRISISLMIFVLKYAFAHIFFTAYTSLGCRKCLIGMLFDHKPDKLLSRTPYRTRVAAHVILKYAKKMPCAPLSNYRDIASKLTGMSSRIKAESEKVVLAPRKPRNDMMTLTSAKYV